MAEPELDLVAHELSSSDQIVGAEECICECVVPPGEECYTCWSCSSVCDGGGGIRCLCDVCTCEGFCECTGFADGSDGGRGASDGALAGNDGGGGGDGGGDDDGGGGNTGGEDGANESV